MNFRETDFHSMENISTLLLERAKKIVTHLSGGGGVQLSGVLYLGATSLSCKWVTGRQTGEQVNRLGVGR